MGVLSTKDPLAEWLGTTDTNCPLGTTTDTSFYLPIHSYNHTLHNISLGSVFLFNRPCLSLSLSLHLIDLDNVNRILKVLSLLLFNTLCEFSVIYLFIKFIFGLCSISVWVMGKQWKRRRKVKFISGFFFFFGCIFLFYIWVFPLYSSCDCQIKNVSLK